MIVCVCFVLTSGASARVNIPKPEVLGIRLEMPMASAYARLKKLGRRDKQTRKLQEVWTINDPRFSQIIIGFNPERRVRYVTAVAREGGRRVRYSEIGKLDSAKQTGGQFYYRYVWVSEGAEAGEREERKEGERKGGRSGYTVTAQGRNAEYLDSFSVKKMNVGEVD